MKTRFTRRAATLCLLFVSLSGIVHGQTLQYWNESGTGGDGIWGTGLGDKNWNLVPGAPAGNSAWQVATDHVAVFQDAIGGFVTVFDTVQTAGIIQSGANYTIDAGTIVLVPDSASNTPFVNVQGGILMIGSFLAGDDGLVKTGDGTLLLSAVNPYAGSTMIAGGTLDLVGSLSSDAVGIDSGASLLNQNGGLSGSATLSNAGSLTLDTDDTIATYTSNGGTLAAGAGTLSTTSATLNDGSTLAGLLDADTLTSDGAVLLGGTATADSASIQSGVLTNTGTFGNPTMLLNIHQDATLAANGIQQYSLLTTSGSGPGTWLGDLHNTTTIAPGGVGEIGILAIGGDFSQSAGGALMFDLSATDNDLLDVTGSATFNGSLELNQLGGTPIAPFVPVTVVSASSYAGNFTSFSENLDGAVWFNPGNGTVTRLGLPTGGGDSIFGATHNQTSTWISLYDDVIDPGITNITSGPAGYEITSGIADTDNPDLLWALASSFTPDGLNAPLLNRLSPEVYGSFSDYAIQATRTHQRSALSAPRLAPLPPAQNGPSAKSGPNAKSGISRSAKSAAKSGVADAFLPLEWEFFAAVDYFRAGTDNSHNQADYNFDGTGVLVGARTRPWDQTQIAAYLGADWGSIHGDLIDADTFGWTLGLIGEHLLDERSRTRLIAGLSYGGYQFDGNRTSVSATGAGWAPGMVRFDDVDVYALDLFVGVDGVAWKQDALTIIPSAGLRYSISKMDSFGESTGAAPGSPITLDVHRDRHESLLLELGLLAQVDVNDDVALWAEGGLNIGLLDSDRVLAANFANGNRTMRAETAGLDDDSVYLGFGALYRINDFIHTSLGYRANLRSGAEAQQEVRLAATWRF